MSKDTATESRPEVVRVQEELLAMLRMAGNEAPPPRREVVAPASTPKVVSHTPDVRKCVKCGSEKPWGKSSWCPDCGFYPKAGFSGTGVAEAEEDKPPPRLIDILPVWAIPMAIGAGTLFVTSIVTRFVFYDALTRSFIAIAQFMCAAIAAFSVHCRASYIAMQSGRSWMAIVNPTETWMLMSQMLPKSKWLIVVVGVGITGVGTSFLIGPDPEMIVKQIQKENKGKKMTFASLISSLNKVTKKAFGKNFAGKDFAMKTVGKLITATGSASASAGGEPANFEDAIGSLASSASLFTAPGGDQAQAAEAPTEPQDDDSEDSSDGSDSESDQPAASASQAPTEPAKAPKKSKSKSSDDSDDEKPSPGGASIAASPSPAGQASGPGDKPLTASSKAWPASTKKGSSATDKETLECWVYGYTANAEGEIRSLLLATKGTSGALKFYQKLALDSLSDSELSQINEDLKPFRSRSAAIKSPYTGKWVKPVVKCRVEHDGMNSEDRPANPAFQSLILP